MKIVTTEDILRLAEEKTIQTTCDTCVFAETEETPEGRLSQTGCKLQRFDKFAENGARILKVEDKTQETDYVVIQDRICNMLRGPEWKTSISEQALEQGIERSLEENDLYTIAREESRLRCTVLIYLGPGQSVKDAYITAQEIQKQEIPAQNTIILNNSGIMPADFLTQWKVLGLMSMDMPALEIPWRMEYIIEFQYPEYLDILANASENEKKELKKRMLLRCIDTGAKKSKTVYYAFFNAKDSIPTNYLSDIDKALNDDLIRILALNPENDSYSGLFMHRKLHEQIGGNKERPCIDKVITQTENQECPNLVLPTKKIVKNFDLR